MPSVIVPVLSSTTVSIADARCRASPLFTRTPSAAPRPIPTTSAVGVARPIAHGHAMTVTVTNATTAWSSRGSGPASAHTAADTSAATSTSGTKIALMRSASSCTGARVDCA